MVRYPIICRSLWLFWSMLSCLFCSRRRRRHSSHAARTRRSSVRASKGVRIHRETRIHDQKSNPNGKDRGVEEIAESRRAGNRDVERSAANEAQTIGGKEDNQAASESVCQHGTTAARRACARAQSGRTWLTLERAVARFACNRGQLQCRNGPNIRQRCTSG